jgi:hypothetical protein
VTTLNFTLIGTFALLQAASRPGESAESWLFRLRASASASPFMEALTEQAVRTPALDELKRILDDQSSLVEAIAAKFSSQNPPPTYQQIVDAADKVADQTAQLLAVWLEEHPDARAPIQRRAHTNEVIIWALAQGDVETITALLQDAGIERTKLGDVRGLVEDARKRVNVVEEAVARSLSDAKTLIHDRRKVAEDLSSLEGQLEIGKIANQARDRLMTMLTPEQRRHFEDAAATMEPRMR